MDYQSLMASMPGPEPELYSGLMRAPASAAQQSPSFWSLFSGAINDAFQRSKEDRLPKDRPPQLGPIDRFVAKTANDLAALPQRAMQSAATYSDTGQYDPAPMVETALTAATGGMPFAARGTLGSAGGKLKSLPSSSSLATPPAPSAAEMLRASKVETVPLSQARGTQSKMQWEKFEAGDHPPPMLKGYEDRPIAVRREDGEYLIFDGHHRTAKAINDGSADMEMYVINAKDYAPEFAGRKPAQPSAPKWGPGDDDLLKLLR